MPAKVYLERATRKDITDRNGVQWAIGQPIVLKDAGENTFHPPAIDPNDRDTYEVRDPYYWVGVLLTPGYANVAGAVIVHARTDADYPAPDPVSGIATVMGEIDELAGGFVKGAKDFASEARGETGGGLLFLLLLGGLVYADSRKGRRR